MDDDYESNKKRGYAYILNHVVFDSQKYGKRSGTERDKSILQKTFLELDFKVKTYDNLTRIEINEKLRNGKTCSIIRNQCLIASMCVSYNILW